MVSCAPVGYRRKYWRVANPLQVTNLPHNFCRIPGCAGMAGTGRRAGTYGFLMLAQNSKTGLLRPLRLWPGVAAVALQWFLLLGLPVVAPDAAMWGVLGGLAGGLLVLLWWLGFSRAAHLERWGVLLLIVIAIAGFWRVLDPSIRTGMMGMMYLPYVVPAVSLALVAGAALGRRLPPWPRRSVLAGAILAACGMWGLLRTEGLTATGKSQFAWRWSATPEQRLVARAAAEAPALANAPEAVPVPAAAPATPEPAAVAPAPAAPRTGAGWPGFRGPGRDSIVSGVRIRTDWASSPPVELWRRAVGPGWSSFAVSGGLVYTQEQRGESEVVACYSAATGRPVWLHRDRTRFWESNGGAGPRGTPAVQGGRVYSLGATGILNALDARSGAVVWSRNAAADTGAKLPMWGFSGSPLPVDDLVIVAVSGRLAAYDAANGQPRWQGPEGGESYSSPHLLTIDGVRQVLFSNVEGTIAVAPSDGTVLWRHAWKGFPLLQPAVASDGGILITNSYEGGGMGTRRLALAHGASGWTADEVWTTNGLKPYFNDIVIHKGHAYGFDGSILSCIDLKDGQRKWKGGRYGYGQMLLLADQDVLLVISEEGELALVAAKPDGFTEIARHPAIEGKTWNHPVVAGELLLVRNDREMAAFRLPVVD
jgi:outer membrane protein assembly factor BamB